ncbi:hypothetical protein SISNIDRAFT_489058 [Sistotremastrum niveocremeum HHB9708]|uniref:F-box domain-containing protein n=2 Tax=Sistotremastraceae TaxID=3402574 RepID=A0A164QG98_9AGAM|nr:hypothetical protein SISNIDRAFT_489058 [Sistotremastrum niveocremeum HHB9708]KZT32989.1 hypothetical protein SISSUDRAFT_1066504 [Sistotremastrum suecicum HHB10207 ss-3]
MLGLLPPETVLQILVYLSFEESLQLYLLSRAWQRFITVNESSIFRNVALQHGISRLDEPTIEALEKRLNGPRWMKGVKSFKQYCFQRLKLEKAWLGEGPVSLRTYGPASEPMDSETPLLDAEPLAVGHRFKIDEQERTIISTCSEGGITVLCMDTGASLFSLPSGYVRPWAHCEFSNGFLIFDRPFNSKEVWRRASDYHAHPEERPDIGPDSLQQRVQEYLHAVQDEQFNEHPELTPSLRGRYEPWSLLTHQNITHAFRFVYPYLLVGSQQAKEAYIWDIPSGTLVRTISIEDPAPIARWDYRMTYVEISQEYIFICTTARLLIFRHGLDGHQVPQEKDSRVTDGTHAMSVPGSNEIQNDLAVLRRSRRRPVLPESAAHILDVPRKRDFPNRDFQDNPLTIAGTHLQIRAMPDAVKHLEIKPPDAFYSSRAVSTDAIGPPQDAYRVPYHFQGIHTSPDGKDFVAITHTGLVFYVENFERALRGEKSFDDIAYSVNVGSSVRNLSFDGGRIAISTDDHFHVFTLDKRRRIHQSDNFGSHMPHLEHDGPFISSICFNYFGKFSHLMQTVSWIALSEDAFWFVWDTEVNERLADPCPQSILCFDFSPPSLST